MKNAIILHGMPSKEEYYSDEYPAQSNMHWIPWLQKQLLMKDFDAQTPEVPNSYKPEYEVWKREFERFSISKDTLLVGHSCGGGFIIRYLSENPDLEVGRVVLVAPWIDADGELTTNMFNFEMDSSIADRTDGLVIFTSDNDFEAVQSSVRKIFGELKDYQHKEFHDYGHFCFRDMKTEEFPELLSACTQ